MSGSRPSSAEGGKASSHQLAFLVHSDPSLPPEVDNPALARQKRRRTSPEDQSILEHEYQQNPKPDRAARARIVGRVALGDKEVQIWFQNRRQKSRSKPLLSGEHETIVAHQHSANPGLSFAVQADLVGHEDEAKTVKENSVPKSLVGGREYQTLYAQGSKEQTKSDSAKSMVLSASSESATQMISSAQTTSTVPATQSTAVTSFSSSQPSPTPQRPTSSGPGYIANRRSASFMKVEAGAAPENGSMFPPSASQPMPTLTRSGSSYLRLSMTEDGKAQVIDRAKPSPNPPRTIDLGTRPPSLRRSYSAAGLNNRLQSIGADCDRVSKMRRRHGPPGRSMDSRAWEFWCDADARSALASKADMETSGNAASAISLMRANGARAGAALQLNTTRQNTPMASQSSTAAGKKLAKQARQPLARASTTYGRFQTRLAESEEEEIGGKPVWQVKKKDGEDWESPNTDSDKENWEPEGLINPRRPHIYEPKWRAPKRVLGENMNIMSESSSLGAMISGPGGGRKGVEVDEEVERFMGKEGGASTPSSGDDIDCVKSLLSLSQGNWR